ncbi:MAG: Hpt domain-containing protein [Gemmatimonadaceae bacterium]
MTTPEKPDLTEALAALRERFRGSSGAIIDIFAGLAARLAADPGDVATLTAVRGESHRVHGTAGSYGFHEASRLAAELELLADRWLADPACNLDRRAEIVERFSERLRAGFRS